MQCCGLLWDYHPDRTGTQLKGLGLNPVPVGFEFLLLWRLFLDVQSIKVELTKSMSVFGFKILHALVTDVVPARKVRPNI